MKYSCKIHLIRRYSAEYQNSTSVIAKHSMSYLHAKFKTTEGFIRHLNV